MGGILRGVKWKMFQNRQFVAYFGIIVFLKAAAIGQEAILRRLGSSPKRSGQYTKTHSALYHNVFGSISNANLL